MKKSIKENINVGNDTNFLNIPIKKEFISVNDKIRELVWYSINSAKEEDATWISKLILYNFDNAPTYKDLEEEYKKWFKACNTKERTLLKIKNPNYICFVIKTSNDEVVWFIAAKYKEMDWEEWFSINRWHIHPNHGKKWFWKYLIMKVIEEAKKKWYKFVEIWPSNKTAEEIVGSLWFENSWSKSNKWPKTLPLFIKKI